MKDDTFERLTEKYMEGNSSLQEEQQLFDNAGDAQPGVEAWSAFGKNNRIEIPGSLNERLWESFQKTRKKRTSFRITTLSAAASALLIITLSVGLPLQKKLSYNKKEALLTEARNMLSQSEQRIYTENVIYEDEIIMIYTLNEK